MLRFVALAIAAVFLTVISQLGGIALLIAACFRRKFLTFLVVYSMLSISAVWVAPMFGRVALSCTSSGPLQMRSVLFCALNRQYVVPELQAVLTDFAEQMDADFAGTETHVLDANFPFFTGFPLLPHLSHDDGEKVDLAFYYQGNDQYLPGVTRSPLGYFAFEDGPTDCPDNRLTLRWDMPWLQRVWPDYQPDHRRMTAALRLLTQDDRVGKLFIEPHLRTRFGVSSDKIRFQGCRAARHDDHIHVQL